MDRARAKELWWFPHNPALTLVARSLATLAGKTGGKLAALLGLLRGFLSRWK